MLTPCSAASRVPELALGGYAALDSACARCALAFIDDVGTPRHSPGRSFQVQKTRKPRRCQPMTVSGLTMRTAERQPRHACESHSQSRRSTFVRRRRGRCDRFGTASWCRSAITSKCSDARYRTRNRSEWTSATKTDGTSRGYSRTLVTSIAATRTVAVSPSLGATPAARRAHLCGVTDASGISDSTGRRRVRRGAARAHCR